jgi:hypothetical protein
MSKHIEAEGGELLIETSNGYKAIIPKNMAEWVKEHIRSGNHAAVDHYVKGLKELKPNAKAQDGGKIPPVKKDLIRPDGTMKDVGYYGALKSPSGQNVTEYSFGTSIGGVDMDIPSLVPGLSKQEIQYILQRADKEMPIGRDPIGNAIADKAIQHAKQRVIKGMSPFYSSVEERARTVMSAESTGNNFGMVAAQNFRMAQQNAEKERLYRKALEDKTGAAEEYFTKRYNTSPHRYKYDTDPQYRKEVDARAAETSKRFGSIDLPATDVRSRNYAGNPNLAFMTQPGMSKEGRRALEQSNLEIIGAALPIPGIDAIRGIPSLTKVGGKLLQSKKIGATLTHPDVKDIANLPTPSGSSPEAIALADFKARIQTPEGRRRLEKLGILGDKQLQDLRMVNTSAEQGAYYPDINYATVNPADKMPANIARHEIEHAVQNAYQSGREQVYGTEFDPFPYMKSHRVTPGQTDIDRSMAMLETWDEPLKNKREWDDFSKSYSYESSPKADKDKMALNYFVWGSNGREKSAFLGEVQQYMLDKKLINHPYQKITIDDVKKAYKQATTDKDDLRLFDIMKPSSYNFAIVRDNLNKMLSLTGAAAGYKSIKGNGKEQ